jgi:glycosyltransferase involved in cell wall biosynthesis
MNSSRPRLCAVVVLYREEAVESLTVRSFNQAMRSEPGLPLEIFVCVYDNSPQPSPLPHDLFPCEWAAFQPRRNNGLAEAYNAALEVARQGGIKWLLLLDSDTEVTAAFLKACLEEMDIAEADDKLAALIPHIVEGGAVHSPRFASAFRRRPVSLTMSGVVDDELVALNSGSVLRVAAVLAIGGFNIDFWLDYLDYWLFRSLYTRGYRVFVLPEILAHSLSFADAAHRMPQERYQNMLGAERYFIMRFGSRWERARLKLVLLKRVLGFVLRDRNASFARMTLRELFRLGGKATPPLSSNVPRLTEKQ